MLNKTKIICTIGSQSENESVLEEMLLAGMNVARLNFANGDLRTQQRYIEVIRKLSLIHDRPISIMLDTHGPKIKTGYFKQEIENIAKGTKVTIYTNKEVEGNAQEFSVNDPELINEINVNDTIILNYGSVKLTVLKIDKRSKKVECIAEKSGTVTSNCAVNIPNIVSSIPILNSDDEAALAFADRMNIDYIAASFVRTAQDVIDIKKGLLDHGASHIQVYAKIENAQAVKNFEEILKVADGIIIPRGDLSVEIPLESLPIIQKKIIRRCNDEGIPVIVGTQILSSMTRNKLPSRAEVSDVANLVLDGVDGLSLSNATTVGMYPVRSVKMLAKILNETEPSCDELSHFGIYPSNFVREGSLNEAVALSVKDTAKAVNAKLIVAFSESGATAKRISMLRPNCAIASVSSNPNIRNTLTLFWGIYPVVSNHPTFEADFVSKASEIAVYYGLKEGDTFIITGGTGVGNTNFMKVCKL